MLAIVAGGAAALALYHRADEEIRRHIEALVAQHYLGLKTSLGSAELIKGKGIRIHDLAIIEPGAEGPGAEILHIDEAMFECSTDWQELVKGDLEVRRATVYRPKLRITRRPDGTWSTAKLLPPPTFGDRPPEVEVKGGLIEIFDPLTSPTSTLLLRDVTLTLVPVPLTEPDAKPGMRRLQGRFAGDGFRSVVVEGWVDLQTSTCSIRGEAEAIEVSPELRDSLPSPLAAKLRALPELRGQGDLRFELSYDPAATAPLKYDVSGHFARGRIDDPRLPHALTDIRATIHVNNAGYAIDDLAARSGQATLRMTLRGAGFDRSSPMSLTAEVRRFDLDRALLGILPQWAQDQWYNYLPTGEVDADVKQLVYDGRSWRRDVAVRCLDVAFTHHKFPYRLEHGKGTLDLKDDQLKMVLTASAAGQPVRLEAEITHPFSGPTGWFKVKGDEIPLDKALLSALPEKPREVVTSLNPRGTVNVYAELWRDSPNEPMHRRLQLAANRCSIRYEKFPYPLGDIRGKLEMIDNNWTFSNLEGTNDKARIVCNGWLTPGAEGSELVLNLAGQDVPLSEDLHDALSKHIQRAWDSMQPRGTVDLTAEIRYLSNQKKFSVGVRAKPQPQNASIEPVHFPYRLDHLEGVLVYRDGRLTFEHCKARHDAVSIATDGYCDILPDGRWGVHFTGLSAERLRADDRELIQALPERLRKAVVELRPTGPINLSGGFELEQLGQPGDPLHSRWDVRLGMQQSNLQCGGLTIENLHGDVTLRGGFDGQHVRSRGELAIDACNYRDCQFRQMMGPVWIDDGRVLFGSWVDKREDNVAVDELTGPPRPPRPLTAKLFDGTLYADGWTTLEAEPHYGVNATLIDADLARCAQDFNAGRHNLRGRVFATADLKGNGRTRNTLSGKGTVRLSNADVYQLPAMVDLLKILRLQLPDQNAFSDAAIDYRIEGEHVYFDRIDFHGDAITLRGKGEMDFQSAIGLSFYATIGRGELDLDVVKKLLRGVSQQAMGIYVTGTLQKPEIRTEALPAVSRAIQGLTGERK